MPKSTLPCADTDNNIAGALKDNAQLRQGGHFRLILARIGFEDSQPSLREKIQRVSFEASFGWKGKSKMSLLS